MRKFKLRQAIMLILFIIYLLMLIKLILFKYPLSMMRHLFANATSTLSSGIEGANYIPFKSICYYIAGNESRRIAIDNILGNIIAFAPLGFLVPAIFTKINNYRKMFLVSFILSLAFETIQLLTSLGAFDVDDIILNVSGAILGYTFYKIVTLIIRNFK